MKYSIILLFMLLQSCGLFGEDPTRTQPKELTELWRFYLNTTGRTAPTVVDDTLFFAAYPYLYASSILDSSIFWMSQIDLFNRFEDKIFLIDKTQLVLNQVNVIKAFSRFDGKLLWEYDTSEQYKLNSSGRHEIHPNGYYFIARHGNLVDISKTGEHKSITDIDSSFGLSGITYLDDTVYINAPDGVNGGLTRGLLKARDYQTGKELWRYETDNCGFYEKPIIEDGILYAASRGNSPKCEVLALNTNDGSIIWRTEEKTFADKILVTSNNVITNSGATLNAYSKIDGSKSWTFSWESNASLIQPVYESAYVYMSNHGSVFVIDEHTGELVHTKPSPGGYIWHMAVTEDRFFIQTDRQLIAYEPWHLREE